MDLWQKHQTRMAYVGDLSFREPVSALLTPVLEPQIIEWAKGQEENKYLVKDLLPRKVGVTGTKSFLHYTEVQCVAVSWAQYQLMVRSEIRESLPEAELFKALAVSCLVLTLDGKLILARRSGEVSQWKNMYHVAAAGYVDLASFLETGSPEAHVFIELKEEVNLDREDVSGLRVLGMCEAVEPESANYDVCYLALTNLLSGDVIEKAKSAKDNWEGKQLAVTREEAVQLLQTEKWDPAGAATLMTYFGL